MKNYILHYFLPKVGIDFFRLRILCMLKSKVTDASGLLSQIICANEFYYNSDEIMTTQIKCVSIELSSNIKDHSHLLNYSSSSSSSSK